MSQTFRLPLAGANETFNITLNGVTYNMLVIWRDDPNGEGGWCLDILTSQNVPLVQGVPLITGADLLEQYAYLGIGGSLFVQTVQDPAAPPTFDNLGTDANVYFVTPQFPPTAIAVAA